jgi:O-antigen ligase
MAAWLAMRRSVPLFVRAAPLVLMGLYLASAYTTLNRTIWLGFIVQLLLLALLLGSRLAVVPQTARRYTLFTAATIIALAGAAASVLILVQEQRQAMGASPLEGDTRLALWPVIAQYIEQRPLTGYGFGRGLLREALGAKLGAIDAHLWHAHNYFLEALIQIGVPGLFLVLILIGVTVRHGWLLARDSHEAVAACGIALVCVVAGMLIRNMTDTLLVRQSALLYWALVGALLGAGTALRSRRACDSSTAEPGGRYSGIQRRN